MESRIPFLNNWVRLLTFYRRLTGCKTPLQEVEGTKSYNWWGRKTPTD